MTPPAFVLEAPWAAVGLLALPVLWWMHRRAQRAAVVELPSLLFLLEEPEAPSRPDRRRVDLDLVLALVAAAALTAAAAGPVRVTGRPGRTVRVVVSGGAPAAVRGYEERVQRVVDDLRARLASADVLEVLREPAGTTSKRPDDESLVAAARAGRPAVSVVVSDRLPRSAALLADAGVRWVAVGEPAARNAGIVALDAGEHLFVNVLVDPPSAGAVHVTAGGGSPRRLEPGKEGFATATFDLPEQRSGVSVRVRMEGDALEADDEVLLLDRAVLAVEDLDSLPSPLRAALDRAAAAAGGVVEAGSPGLVLFPAPGESLRAEPGGDVVSSDALVRDLSTSGVDLRFAPGALAAARDAETLLSRVAARAWPVVVRRGGSVLFLPDPLGGTPSPAQSALWPLFVANALEERAGEPLAGGWRRRGLLDVESTRLGRDVQALDPRWLEAAPPDRREQRTELRPWLIGAALLALGALWLGRR